MVRLNKYLAGCGVASRRACDRLIADGKVMVNGRVEQRMGTRIDAFVDSVVVENQVLRPAGKAVYLLLNKPKGVVTTASDEKGRKTVLDLVRCRERVFPVGRLDINTTGLLLLTNDGALAFHLTHPRFEVDKVYEAKLDRELDEPDRLQLEAGIRLEEGVTSPCQIYSPDKRQKTQVRVTLHQGWKRQIRRMFDAVGYKVVELKRVKLASLDLADLLPGEYRSLTSVEVAQLTKESNGN